MSYAQLIVRTLEVLADGHTDTNDEPCKSFIDDIANSFIRLAFEKTPEIGDAYLIIYRNLKCFAQYERDNNGNRC